MKQGLILIGLLLLIVILGKLFELVTDDAKQINHQWIRGEEIATRIDTHLERHGQLPATLELIGDLPRQSFSVENPLDFLKEFHYPVAAANAVLTKGMTNVPVLFQHSKNKSPERRGLVCFVRPASCRVLSFAEIEQLKENLEKERK